MTDERIVDAALTYAHRGWSVVPIHTPEPEGCSCRRSACPIVGKHPRIQWETHMRMTATEETITGWWQRWPGGNVGVVTGSVSDVVVLDIDPRSDGDGSLQALEDRWGMLPVTAVVRTGGGGWHYWFSAGDTQTPSRVLSSGLDLLRAAEVAVFVEGRPPLRDRRSEFCRWTSKDHREPVMLAAANRGGTYPDRHACEPVARRLRGSGRRSARFHTG